MLVSVYFFGLMSVLLVFGCRGTLNVHSFAYLACEYLSFIDANTCKYTHFVSRSIKIMHTALMVIEIIMIMK